MEREDIIKIGKLIGVKVSPFQAIESLFFARQSTSSNANFDLELLKKWLCRNLPLLRSIHNK